MMTDNLSITLLQCDLQWKNPLENRAQIEIYLESVMQADVIFLPEMFSTGFSVEATYLAETMDGDTIRWMKKIAVEKQTVLCGSLMIKAEAKIYNRLIWVEPNGLIQHYDKRHLFSLINEEKHFTAGAERLIIDYKGWRICPLICYDLRFPIFSRNDVNYDVCVYLANWPNKRIEAWDVLLKARAIENQSYVIGLNRVGFDGYKADYSGHSQVISPNGDVIASAPDNEIGLVEFTLSKPHLEALREHLPFLNDRDNFELSN